MLEGLECVQGCVVDEGSPRGGVAFLLCLSKVSVNVMFTFKGVCTVLHEEKLRR